MKSLVVLGLVIVLLTPSLALAGQRRHHHRMSGTDWALALGSFAVANQILTGQTIFQKLFGGITGEQSTGSQQSAASQPLSPTR